MTLRIAYQHHDRCWVYELPYEQALAILRRQRLFMSEYRLHHRPSWVLLPPVQGKTRK